MFKIGDVVRIYAPSAGYNKYHLCVKESDGTTVEEFLFLNSDPGFDGVYVVDNVRVPCLPPSETGKIVFSFAMIPRFTEKQLTLFNAVKLGTLDPALAAELHAFAQTVRTMTRPEKQMVLAALALIAGL